MKKYKYIEIDGEPFIEEVNPITNIFDQKIHRKEEFESFKPQKYSWIGEPFEGEISESEVEIKTQVRSVKGWRDLASYEFNINLTDIKKRSAATLKQKPEEYCNHCYERGGVKRLSCNSCDPFYGIDMSIYTQRIEPYGYVFENKFYKSLEELKGQTFFEGNDPVAVYTKSS